MKLSRFLLYTSLIFAIAGGAIWYIISNSNETEAQASAQDVVMYKNEGCQCCEKWGQYMQGSGYTVKSVNAQNLSEIKNEEKIPRNMGACHTAIVGDYVVEGHVPAQDVKKLLAEQPDALGLVVPGMPASSPGMNTALNEPYKVYLLKNDGSTEVFAQH